MKITLYYDILMYMKDIERIDKISSLEPKGDIDWSNNRQEK